MNDSLACDCPPSRNDVAIPLAIVALCISLTSLVASFFTHSKVLKLDQSIMRGQRLYGKMAMIES